MSKHVSESLLPPNKLIEECRKTIRSLADLPNNALSGLHSFFDLNPEQISQTILMESIANCNQKIKNLKIEISALKEIELKANEILEFMKLKNYETIRETKKTIYIILKKLYGFDDYKPITLLLKQRTEKLSEQIVNKALGSCRQSILSLEKYIGVYEKIKFEINQTEKNINQQKSDKIVALASQFTLFDNDKFTSFNKIKKNIQFFAQLPNDLNQIVLNYLDIKDPGVPCNLNKLYDSYHEKLKPFLNRLLTLRLPLYWSQNLEDLSAILESFFEAKDLNIAIRHLPAPEDKITAGYVGKICFEKQIWYEKYNGAKGAVVAMVSDHHRAQKISMNEYARMDSDYRENHHIRSGFGADCVKMKLQDSFRVMDYGHLSVLYREGFSLFRDFELLWKELNCTENHTVAKMNLF